MVKKTKKPKAKKIKLVDTWSEPDSGLIKDSKIPPPEFPLDIYPENIRKVITDVAASKAAPVDFIASPLLGIVAGAIGNARLSVPYTGWEEHSIIWIIMVGDPSSGKSPSLKAIKEPIAIYEKHLSELYKPILKQYKIDYDKADAHYKAWRKKQKDAIAKDEEPPEKPEEAEYPVKPKRPRILLVDTTIEEAGSILSGNAKGVILIRDELSGFFKNFNAYSSGQDREFYIEAYTGDFKTVDRVKLEEPINIEFLSISIIGTIQPDKFNSILINTDDDGFTARFLYTWPNSVPFEKPINIPNIKLLELIVQKLRDLDFPVDNKNKHIPIKVPFSKKAQNIFVKWRKILPEREALYDGMLKSHIGKLPGMVVRVALVLSYLDWAASNSKAESTEILDKFVKKAIKVIDEYFFPMAQRVLGEASLPQEQRDARVIAKWILRNKPEIINVREFSRTEGSPLRDTKRLKNAFDFMVDSNWVEFDGKREGETIGRKKQNYTINPKVYDFIK